MKKILAVVIFDFFTKFVIFSPKKTDYIDKTPFFQVSEFGTERVKGVLFRQFWGLFGPNFDTLKMFSKSFNKIGIENASRSFEEMPAFQKLFSNNPRESSRKRI